MLSNRQIWRDIVDALPGIGSILPGSSSCAGWWRRRAIAERRETRLRQLRAQDRDGGEDADALAAQHGASAKTVAYLLGQLRATPRSRVVSRAPGPQIRTGP